MIVFHSWIINISILNYTRFQEIEIALKILDALVSTCRHLRWALPMVWQACRKWHAKVQESTRYISFATLVIIVTLWKNNMSVSENERQTISYCPKSTKWWQELPDYSSVLLKLAILKQQWICRLMKISDTCSCTVLQKKLRTSIEGRSFCLTGYQVF